MRRQPLETPLNPPTPAQLLPMWARSISTPLELSTHLKLLQQEDQSAAALWLVLSLSNLELVLRAASDMKNRPKLGWWGGRGQVWGRG